LKHVALFLLAVVACGCAAAKTDYGPYLRHMPKSVVVLPPLNESTVVSAPDAFLSTITFSLAERGYYVFPVVLVDQYMKENGLPTPGEMHQIRPRKVGEVFGADAVLYITIKKWTTTYTFVDSSTIVSMDYRLVDAKTESELWRREQVVRYSSSSGQSNIIGMVAAAAAHAASNHDSEYERRLAVLANQQVVGDPRHGMIVAAHHPSFEQDQRRRREEMAKAK
jgi:hypothetical protein